MKSTWSATADNMCNAIIHCFHQLLKRICGCSILHQPLSNFTIFVFCAEFLKNVHIFGNIIPIFEGHALLKPELVDFHLLYAFLYSKLLESYHVKIKVTRYFGKSCSILIGKMLFKKQKGVTVLH